ncbi:MAG: MBL fold metallo-hydrolase, partial [Clostridia bacterium]|nr:MBL fold metallo-hydrolase [Clostridia bacterium]
MDKSFEVYTLFSSSKGNSVYIRAGHTRLLVDIGRSRKAINDALASVGSSLNEIDAIFITHAHSDHTLGLAAKAAKEWTPIQ